MDNQDSLMAANAIAHEAYMTRVGIVHTFTDYNRPSVVFRPSLSKDGTAWCALLGENIQTGCCGFGDSPAAAMQAFDIAFNRSEEHDKTGNIRQAA